MNLDALGALNLYGVKITASYMLPPELFVIDDWGDPKNNNHPEWISVWCIGKEMMVAHPTVLHKLANQWEEFKYHQSPKT